MFGYIRPVQGELLVKEAHFYEAVYCGLCRYSGKHISHFSRFLLNYDFTFLAILRLSLTEETPSVKKMRCPYKLHRKNTVCCDPVFSYTAEAFGLFLYYKWLDDLQDERGLSRFGKRLLTPFFRHVRKKCRTYPALEEYIRVPIEQLRELERARCDSPDRVADCFGRILKEIAAYDLTGNKRAVAEQCGYHIGRFIYLIDAYDDLFSDEKSGNYNPFLVQYGSAEEALAHEAEICLTLQDSMRVFSRSYALVCPPVLTGTDRILFNICDLGATEAIEKIRKGYETKGNKANV